MRFRSGVALAALFALSFSVGCSMNNPIVRGQAPENNGPILGSAPGYGDLQKTPYLGSHGKHDFKPYNGFRDHNFGYDGGFYAGPDGYYTDRNIPYTVNGQAAGAGCPHCQFGNACPADGCPQCGHGCLHKFPHHYQTYQYDWPQNQVYPQQGVPSGVVQYPYYTLRGPTDFFMK